MEISQANPAAAQTQAAAASASSQSAISSDFTTFLKMLTAQIQNQDPLDPMSSEDFATQLATFSGVEQQVKTNDLLASLGQQMGIMGMAQLASWIGLDARAAAPTYFNGSPISISPNPAAAADKAVLVVRDEDGNEVQRHEFTPSTDEIQWAGVNSNGDPFENGIYSFDIESYSGDELLATSKGEVYSKVMEAKSLNGDVVLVLSGGIEIKSTDVTGLRGDD